MKTALPILLVILSIGCSPKSPYDVSADQVKQRVVKGGMGPGPGFDLKHLPPGAVKHEKTFKKGETLPDGSIAQGNEHIVQVTVDKQSP